jgi:hypothetical protein
MGFLNWLRKPASPTPPITQPTADRLASFGPTTRVLSYLKPDIAFHSGLPNAAIAGTFRAESDAPDDFVANPEFLELLHQVIIEHVPGSPGFAEAARKQGNGSISIIDHRTPDGPMGNVPPEDIIGAFAVVNGAASAQTYHRNPHYRVYTRNGLTRLPAPLHAILVDKLTRLAKEKTR